MRAMPLSPSPSRRPAGPLVFVHPSDELYGADRMLLAMVEAARDDPRVPGLEGWLPTDLAPPAPELSLCRLLEERGVVVRHLDLPVLRRAYRTPAGLARLARRGAGLLGRVRPPRGSAGYFHSTGAGLLGRLRRSRVSTVYCTSSATLLAAPVARLAGVPRVLGHVQEIWSRADLAALALPARSCHQLVAISGAAAGSLPQALLRRTTVVPNGSPDPGTPVPLDGRTGPLRSLVASRWNGWKGHRT